MLYVLLAGFALVFTATSTHSGHGDTSRSASLVQWTGTSTACLAAATLVLTYVAMAAVAALQVRPRRVQTFGGLEPDPVSDAAVARYQIINTASRFALIAGFVVLIFFTDWVTVVLHEWYLVYMPLIASLALVSPFLIAAVLGWLVQYPAVRVVGELVNADLAALGRRPRKSRPLLDYLWHQIRQQLLFVMVPMSPVLLVSDVMMLLRPGINQFAITLPGSDEPIRLLFLDQGIIGVSVGVVFLFVPLLIRWLWPTRPMPPGALRDRLDAIARRHGIGYRDILIWETGNAVVNAAVIGLLPRMRYVLFSDGLLETMTPRQVEAVFGHELGHLVHRHILKLALASVCSASAVAGGMVVTRYTLAHLARELEQPAILQLVSGQAGELLQFAAMAAMWFLLFGWVSRLFERQADEFGARSVEDPGPGAVTTARRTPPLAWANDDQATEAALLAAMLVPATTQRATESKTPALTLNGVDAFVSALNTVVISNGMDRTHFDWRHGSIQNRIEHLYAIATDERRARQFHRRLVTLSALLWSVALLSGGLSTYLYLFGR